MLSVDDLLFFVDESLEAMVAIVGELGDDLANRRPAVEGVNAPYVTLVHCVGVIEHWGGHVIAGRDVDRQRDTEFSATGSAEALVTRVRDARRQLAVDLEHLDPGAPPRGSLAADDAELPIGATQGGALLHLYSEFAIHRGHMEICRDLLVAGITTATGPGTPEPDSRYPDRNR